MDSLPSGFPNEREEDLSLENRRLLEELELAYRQLEFHLTSSKQEARVTYNELERKNRQLEQQLAELEQAYRELKEAENQVIRSARLAAMGELAASIVHEINNPLGAIYGIIELMLLQGDLDASQRKSLNIVLGETEGLARLARDVLSFSRRQIVQGQLVDINDLLEDVLSFLGEVKKNVEIEVTFDQALPQVSADPGQLQQVFMNLLLNASDAMPEGGRVDVHTTSTDLPSILSRERTLGRPYALASGKEEESKGRDGPLVCVDISDQGDGISEDKLSKIFDAFFTTKGEKEGTGLGLSICRTIIGRCGGDILVASKVGEGSTFSVFLPVWKGEEA